jgi:hypothetical protein
MLKACALIKCKLGIDVEAFQTFWLGKHAHIVKQLPFVKRYVQSHPLLEVTAKQTLFMMALQKPASIIPRRFDPWQAQILVVLSATDEANLID